MHELPSLFDNRIRCLFALGLMLAFLSDDTLADRILSETIVGDPVVSPLPTVLTGPRDYGQATDTPELTQPPGFGADRTIRAYEADGRCRPISAFKCLVHEWGDRVSEFFHLDGHDRSGV